MRICIVCQLYPPEYAPIGVMVRELAQALTARGHTVTVVTAFPNHPAGVVFPGYRQRLRLMERDGEISLVRCFMHVSPQRTVLSRVLSYLTFGVSSFLAIMTLPRHDVLLIPSPPLTNGLIALALRLLRNMPYVFNVQDIYPDAAVGAGVVTSPPLIRILQWLERLVYRCARRVTVISEGFRDNLVAKGVPAGKIDVIYNWLDGREIKPQSRKNKFAQSHGLSDKFVVLYSGTIGLISGAEIMLETARLLAGCPDILFLFVGEGVVKQDLMRRAVDQGLSNMMFLPFQPRTLLSQVQSSSDVSVVTLKPGMGLTSVPSKVLGYMAAAKPIIASVDSGSDTHTLIVKAKCGLWTPPGDAQALANAILSLRKDPILRMNLGRNGRKFLQANCDFRVATAQYSRILTEEAGGKK